MKVTHPTSTDLNQIEKAKESQKRDAVRPSEIKKDVPKDLSSASSVELSENARLMRQASDAVASAKIDNSEKIAALKKQIAEGKYRVDSDSVAEKLITEHLFTNFGKNSL